MVCGDLWASTGGGQPAWSWRANAIRGSVVNLSPCQVAAVTTARLRESACWGWVMVVFDPSFWSPGARSYSVLCAACWLRRWFFYIFFGYAFPDRWRLGGGRLLRRLRMSPDRQSCPSQPAVTDKLVAFSTCSFPPKRKWAERWEHAPKADRFFSSVTQLQSFKYRPNPQLGHHFITWDGRQPLLAERVRWLHFTPHNGRWQPSQPPSLPRPRHQPSHHPWCERKREGKK